MRRGLDDEVGREVGGRDDARALLQVRDVVEEERDLVRRLDGLDAVRARERE